MENTQIERDKTNVIDIEVFNRTLIITSFFIYFVIRPIDKFLMIHYKIIPNINFTLLIIVMLGIYITINIIINWRNLIKIQFKPSMIAGACIIGALAIITIINAPRALEYASIGQYVNTIADVTIQGIFFFIIGINYRYLVKPSEKARKIMYIGYIIFVATVLWGVAINPDKTVFFVHMAGEKSYFTLSDSMAIYSFLILVLCRRNISKIVVAIMSTACLYATLSRTSLYLFVGIAILYFITKFKNFKQVIAVGCILSVLGGVGIFYVAYKGGLHLTNSRMVNLIFNKEKDQSYLSRQEILKEGKEDIKNNLLTGKLLVEVERGKPGKYIHNILSYLQQYGIIVFVLFIGLVAYCGLKTIILLVKDWRDEEVLFLASLILYTFVAVIFSRAYNYVYIWMSIGICLEMDVIRGQKELKSNDGISVSSDL
ncbi:O-antigen ligase family protein [Clostridium paraputrificum]|uniref:O-antigen ligase family protein n=1 Tax=Clostridium TaxID=1485 RepID=UPI003D338104